MLDIAIVDGSGTAASSYDERPPAASAPGSAANVEPATASGALTSGVADGS
jgi:hypothetical protein